jgi:NAD(P)-dependent dehydrogenase (short-subunit alcohol dehydrogenase family)
MNVIVTGGAGVIGKGIARRFVKDGHAVVIFDVNTKAGRQTARDLSGSGTAYFIKVDVASESSVRTGFEKVAERTGFIDAIINNAGITAPEAGPIKELDLAHWHRVIDVNLTSIVLTSKYGFPLFRQGRGNIVNIASSRFMQSEKNTFAYSASKGGVVSLTHSLAISLGPDIRVNCISPGWITGEHLKLSKADHEQHPVGRAGHPEDIASLAAFLVSGEAGFITGQNFIADGGMTRKMIYVE